MLTALIFYMVLFIAVVVFPAALILGVLLFFEHERQLWQHLRRVVGPIGAIMVRWPVIRGFAYRFPRLVNVVGRRLDPKEPWGLPGTIASIGVLVGLWFFLGVLQDIVAKDPLVILNVRFHNTVPFFRSTGMTWFMLALTQAGSPPVLSLLCIGLAALALAHHKRRLAATFLLALAGTALLSVTLKALVGYARPVDAMIHVHEASFPSGHMLSSTVVYGLLASVLLASHVSRVVRALGVTLLVLVIVGIGLSRLYLGVHWPSDILGSLALALIALSCLLFFLHYEAPFSWLDTFKLPLGEGMLRTGGGAIVLCALGAIALLTLQTELVPVRAPALAHTITLEALTRSLPPDLPVVSEDLIGGRMEPISLVFVGSEQDLVTTFAHAGWMRADSPTPLRVSREALFALRNLPDPSGPATPAYFADRPQDLTFEKPDGGTPSIRRRHHTRVWKTAYCVAVNCCPVWVATASFDVGIEISTRLHLPTHRIEPAIDKERALIVADLVGSGAIQEGSVTVSGQQNGTNAAGDPWSTDGRAFVINLK